MSTGGIVLQETSHLVEYSYLAEQIKLLCSASTYPELTDEEVNDYLIPLAETLEAGTYRINKAVRRGWLIKAGKASASYEFTDNSLNLKRNQIIENCLKMANKYNVIDSALITNNYRNEVILYNTLGINEIRDVS